MDRDPVHLQPLLAAWHTAGFEGRLKQTIENLGREVLPLQQGLSQGGYALDDAVRAVWLQGRESEQDLRLKLGLFYTSVIAGCNCADDPCPVDTQTEYCEIVVKIQKPTGAAEISLVNSENS